MPSKRIRQTILFILLLSIIYNLLKATNTPFLQISAARANRNTKIQLVNISSVALGTHVPMPKRLKGKAVPFHKVFEPREIGFLDNLRIAQPTNKTKMILVWTSWNKIKKTINYYFLRPGNKTFKRHNCPISNCIATFNRKNLPKADAVLFHLLDVKLTDLPQSRTPWQVWIVYNMEPPWQIRKHLSTTIHHLKNIFNWTMSYKRNSDVIVRYGFTSRINKTLQLTSNFDYKSKMAAWFVSDCKTDSRREDYIAELKKHIEVDIYGKCGQNKCYPSQSSICYEEVLKNYRFYLSFENAMCEDYVTEKFFNVFNYDIVPVVLGAVNYSSIAPEESFVDATKFSKPELLAKALIRIAKSDDMYKKFLEKKLLYKAYLDPWMCKLCSKLHAPLKMSTVESMEKWFSVNEQCQRWDKEHESFVNIQNWN